MKILFVGDLNKTGRCFQRYRTLIDLGHAVRGLTNSPIVSDNVDRSTFLQKVFWKLKIPLDVAGVNKQIKDAVALDTFDVIWVEKGNTIKPSTLRFIKQHRPDSKLISVSEDNMYAWHNRSLYYTLGLKYYDIIFTTKTFGLVELKTLGAKRVQLFLDAYDEKLHRPMTPSPEDKDRYNCDVGFIGTFEEDRANKMLYLAERGIKVVIWGNGWSGWKNKHPKLIIKNKPIYGKEYVKAINATKINLCFLRKKNRDEVTSRSVEIPACKAFMLGERTKRHLDFFDEGREAEFFSSEKELKEKINKYLKGDLKRKRIAESGYERCKKSGYSMKNQLSQMLTKVKKINHE